MHDRRQRRRELRWRALPQARLHRQPRPLRRRRPARRRARHPLPRRRRARICSASSSAPEGTLGIAVRITVGLLRAPETVSTLLAGFETLDSGRRRGLAGDRERDPALGDRDDGRPHDRGCRGRGRGRLPEGRRRGADRRARRAGGTGRRGVRRRRGALPAGGSVRAARRRDRRGARPDLAGPQIVVRRDGPDLVELLRPGRRRAPYPAARGAAAHRRARRRVRPSCRKRVPRRRREPPPTRALRRGGRGRAREGGTARDGDPRRVHRRRRVADRRARRRGRQGLLDAEALLGARPRGDADSSGRLRPGRDREPRQGVSRPRASAGRSLAPTARTRSRGQALSSVSEPATLEEAAEVLGGSGHGLDRPGRR